MTEPDPSEIDPEERRRRRIARWAAWAALSPHEQLKQRLQEFAAERERVAAVFDVRPHATHFRVGDIFHFDLFLRNQGSEPVWVESSLTYPWVRVCDEKYETREFPGWEPPRHPETLFTRDDFIRLQPGMCLARFDATGDRLVLPEPGRFVLRVGVDTGDARICAYCYGFGQQYANPVPDTVEIEVAA